MKKSIINISNNKKIEWKDFIKYRRTYAPSWCNNDNEVKEAIITNITNLLQFLEKKEEKKVILSLFKNDNFENSYKEINDLLIDLYEMSIDSLWSVNKTLENYLIIINTKGTKAITAKLCEKSNKNKIL